MSEQELSAKEAYFNEQALLDLSDDEQASPGPFTDELNRALADSKAMPPPLSTLRRQGSSLLGPKPKRRLADFETHTTKQRADQRETGLKLTRSSTAPENELTGSFPVTKPRNGQAPSRRGANKLKRVSSLPELTTVDQRPFYIQVGVIPRELKNGKIVKPADNIRLEPEHKQLLKGKIIYFYPNDDISLSRRTRIHKVIQLGAAWVTRWQDDITHVMLDDTTYTYPQLLKHLNKAGISVSTLDCAMLIILTVESDDWFW
jgi:DNA polymerase IV